MQQPVVVSGTGSHLPEHVVTNEYLESIVDTSDEWIVQRTGIRELRKVAPDEATSDIATEATRNALESARPTSSLAAITMRRAMNRLSSPA